MPGAGIELLSYRREIAFIIRFKAERIHGVAFILAAIKIGLEQGFQVCALLPMVLFFFCQSFIPILIAIVEVLVPGKGLRIAGKLGRTPVVVIGKTALKQ